MPTLLLKSHAISDVGLKRDNNEDAFRVLEKEQFFILADGMGGHNAGEVASSRAVEYMCSAMQNFLLTPPIDLSTDDLKSHLFALVENTNLWVHHLGASDPTLFGMGTTLSSFVVYRNKIIYSHVGDSRIYRFRDNQLVQLTRDQVVSSLPPLSFEEDEATQEFDDRIQLGRKMLAQAIGTSILVAPEVGELDAKSGDLYLICSDGLTDCVENETIESVLRNSTSLDDSGEELISMAKAGGGHDNITLVLVQVVS